MAKIRFRHEPRTEQELVCLFIALLEHIDQFAKPIIIERVHEAFPDCTIRAADKRINIEFKLYADSYNHKFDGSVLVCWKDNRRKWPAGFHPIELAPIVAARHPDLLIADDDTYMKGKWDERTFFRAAERDGTPAAAIEAMREVVRWADSVALGPLWQQDPKPQFDVGRRSAEPLFTVWSDGMFRLVIKRLMGTAELDRLWQELNIVAPSLGCGPDSARSKRRFSLTGHFGNPEALKQFLEVWERF